jgi:predicted nucleic acid-binding protein
MTEVFADTFYWIAFTNIQDTVYERAKAFMRTTPPRLIVTTEEVLTEYLNYFAAWGPDFRRTATTNIQNMRASRTVRIVPQSMASFQAGLMLYQARPDKG